MQRRGISHGKMEPAFSTALSRVALCGGTHGNELSGVYVVREMQKAERERFGSFALTTVTSNPRAVAVCRRYTETDLNRCFTNAVLSAPLTDDTPYEVRRAQELNAHLGPKGSEEAVDLLIDLHNTTANVGLLVIACYVDVVTLHLYKYMQEKMPSVPVRFMEMGEKRSEAFSQESLGKHGVTIEVGPQPHGVIRADIYALMKEAVSTMLEWVDSFNSGTLFEGGGVEVYTHVEKIDYPRDPETHQLAAAIHPQLQDNDFTLLRPGDPIFQPFSGDAIRYEGKELYPYFVNESAYYEKKVAFSLARKVHRIIPSLSVKRDQ